MPEIHPSALVSGDAQLADDVTIGAFSIIDGPAVIGAGTVIGPHVYIRGRVAMGSGNTIGYGAVVGEYPQSLGFDPSIDSGVVLGDNNILREYVTIHRSMNDGANTTLGSENFLMTTVHIGHDVQAGDGNVIGSNVLFAGHIELGNRVFIGGAAAMHQFIRIGDFAMIAGQAGISRDIPPYCLTTRTDRLAGLNSIGLRRAGFTPEQRKELKSAFAILFQQDLSRADSLAKADASEWSPAAQKLIEAVRNPSQRGVVTRKA
jgi:UDP-N-acetylglucosamine acyltransferase